MELKRRIKRKLKALMGNQTQEVFASKIGVTQTTLNRLLKGNHNIGINTLEKICKFSGLKIEELLGCSSEDGTDESDQPSSPLRDNAPCSESSSLKTNSKQESAQS